MIPLLTIFSTDVSGQVWKKVTSAPDSWAGEYLLVYESSSSAGKAWTGVDAASCGADVTISSGVISTKPDGAVSITVSAYSGGYSIKINGGTNNGKYIGRSANSNGMDIGNSAVKNTFSYVTDNVKIVGAGGAVLRYNKGTGNERFRYFKSSTYTAQQVIQLYKKSYTVTYNANGGSGTMTDSNSPYDAGATVTTKTNTFTNSGYTFDHWDTKADDSGTDYAEGATFTISANTTLYAQWASAGSTPTITVSETSFDFGTVKVGGSYTRTFTVSGEDLTDDIELAISGAQSGRYSVDIASLTPDAGGAVAETTITVTFAPTAASDHAAQVDITSLGATSKTVTLHAISQWEVTWMNNGVQYQTTLTTEVGGHHRPVLPTPNPSSCDGTSTTFRGWTQTPWSGKQSQSYVDGLTTDATKVFLDNTAMPDVSSNSVVYHAVFVKATGSDESDVINYSATSSQLGEQSTTAYQSNFTITGSTGAQYRIHSMGTGSGVALRWNSNGFLYCTSAPTSGAKLSSVTITTTADKSIGVYASTSAYSGDAKPTATSLGTVTATSSGATKNITADTYSYIGLVGTTSSTIISSITITYGGTTYSDYLTTCCTSYDITLSGGGTVSGGTFSASVPSACAGNEVTLSNSICSGYTVGAWTITKTSNGDDVTASVLEGNTLTMPAYGVTVALSTTAKVDHFIDQMHETAEYTGEGYAVSGCNQTVPTIGNKSKGSECVGEHYKFVGWVDEDHVDSDGTLLSGYSIVAGETTSWNATGTNYYAVWAKEE